MPTLTKVDLIDKVQKSFEKEDIQTFDNKRGSHSYGKKEAVAFYETVIEEIIDSLISDRSVKIPSFGSFQVRNKKAREGRNPVTQENALISERDVVLFKPSEKLRKKVETKKKEPMK